MRFRLWKQRRDEKYSQLAPPSSSYNVDPGRLRDPVNDKVPAKPQEDIMQYLKEQTRRGVGK
jgi:hypothetical protein